MKYFKDPNPVHDEMHIISSICAHVLNHKNMDISDPDAPSWISFMPYKGVHFQGYMVIQSLNQDR